MINENCRPKKNLKLLQLIPLVFVSFCLFSCAVEDVPELTQNEIIDNSVQTDSEVSSEFEDTLIITGKDTVLGYPSSSYSTSFTRSKLEKGGVHGLQVQSLELSAEGNSLGKKYVIGYPMRPKILLAPTPDEVSFYKQEPSHNDE